MLNEHQFQLIKDWVDQHLPDRYLIRVSIGLVALAFVIPGVFQLGPPKWFGDAQHTTDHAVSQIETPNPGAAFDDVTTEGADNEIAVTTSQDDMPVVDAQDSKSKQGDIAGYAGADVEKAAPLPVGQTVLVPDASKEEEPAVRARDTAPKKTPKAQPDVAAIEENFGEPPAVSRVFAKTIPAGHGDLVGNSQKEQFIATVLPLILASNEEIAQRRAAILRAVENGDIEAIKKWARLYRLSDDEASVAELESMLMRRTREIPVAIALAQAVVESGWGTSRFARQGNALFGQWAWDKSAGLRPLEASNSRAVVRSFPNLFGSVRAYMHNLNTHRRYQMFRDQREKIANASNAKKADQLVEYLDGYAETGYDYVVKLRSIMRTNKLNKYADAYLQ